MITLLLYKYSVANAYLLFSLVYHGKNMPVQENIDSFVLNTLTCPITLELFVDPVLADDGYTYERSPIVEWIQGNNGTSPITRQPIKLNQLKPNRIVKQLADQCRSSTPALEIEKKELVLFSRNGTLLNKEQQLLLNRSFRKEKRWMLIYEATQNGFSSDDFHRHCDNRSATLTLIETCSRLHRRKHNAVFGGYTTIPWSSHHSFYRDPQAFLILLDKNGITRFYARSSNQVAVSHYPTTGPVFGLDDIYICDRPNHHNLSYSRFPSSYEDLDENGKGRKTFSKSKYFLVNEIEVYVVII